MPLEPQAASRVEVSSQALMRLVDLARRAGAEILERVGRGSELKPDGSPVTPADCAAQDVICAGLTGWDPSVPIVAEESAPPDPAARVDWSRYWLVDPLDGTKEFLAGRPDFTVNIALIEDGTPVLGVVGAPAMATVYWAGRGLGAWRQDGQQPATRLRRTPPTGEGVRIVESRSHPSPELEVFLRQVRVTERVQVGSSLKFCWIADGRADCYPRLGPTMAWDVAAGDCVFRYSSAGLEPFPSPLTYDPLHLRQPPFVIGWSSVS
jgi:3'(2'), 5'-bisphosphate nucleotidase